MSKKYELDEEQMRIAMAIRAGNQMSSEDAANGVARFVVSYFLYTAIFSVTIPITVICSTIIGVHSDGIIGWSAFIINMILTFIRPNLHIVIALILLVVAIGMAGQPN